ncbi:unnamed protein product [Lota lota]
MDSDRNFHSRIKTITQPAEYHLKDVSRNTDLMSPQDLERESAPQPPASAGPLVQICCPRDSPSQPDASLTKPIVTLWLPGARGTRNRVLVVPGTGCSWNQEPGARGTRNRVLVEPGTALWFNKGFLKAMPIGQ